MDYQKIVELVIDTGRMLLEDHPDLGIRKKGRADFVTVMDVTVQKTLEKALAELHPSIIFMAEEQDRIAIDHEKEYWILDPIDGTQNFIRNVGMSAISLAHYAAGSLRFGVVYNPFTGEVFYGERGHGARLRNLFLGTKEKLSVTDTEKLADSLLAIGTSPYDRQFAETNFPMFQELFSKSLDVRRGGSAALDICYVAAGRYDGYVERNLKPWDMAAGTLILEEAGGSVTDYTGKPYVIGGNLDIIATNGRIREEITGIVRKHWPAEKL